MTQEPEQPASQQRLGRRSDRQCVELARAIAHEFNNVLSAISGYTQLARAEIDPASPTQSHLTEVVRACDRGAAMTARLMAYSRSGQGDPRTLDVSACVRDMLPMLQRLLGPRVELVTELDGGLPPVAVDPDQVRRLLVNLAVNARDAMPEGGVLRIATRRRRDGVELVVSDTGTGMDEEVRHRVFEPFFTTKPEGTGSGLGLATVHGIVTGSGGRIAVESAPGAGTTFSIALPADAAAA